jgi:glycosyltransferase involved in cell wall biosynthesis
MKALLGAEQEGHHVARERMKQAPDGRILFVAVHPPDRVPSQRFRFEQYVPFLAKEGLLTTFAPLIRPEEYGVVYGQNGLARKAWIGVRGLGRRAADLLRLRRFDIVVVQREAIQLGTALFERVAAGIGPRLVFDFDDAIWLPNVSAANSRLAWLKNADKTSQIIKAADVVFAGNDYLANYARRFNGAVRVVPTTIDTEQYIPNLGFKREGGLTIGWTGSMTTIPHFQLLVPTLRRLKDRFGERVRFEVIGDRNYREPGLGIVGRKWSAATEVADLSRFDIGVMPLPDDKWARGKCGLKGLQYMALAIPTIMSPTGVNSQIIEDGRNGLLASSDDEWLDKLGRLVESETLRRRLGRAGRETVEASYSVESQKHRYLHYLQALLG